MFSEEMVGGTHEKELGSEWTYCYIISTRSFEMLLREIHSNI